MDAIEIEAARCRSVLSLVLPAYNEQEVIAQAIEEADDALKGLHGDSSALHRCNSQGHAQSCD